MTRRPTTLDPAAIREWIATRFPAGQLVLLPRADEGLAKSRFRSPALVIDALEMLGEEYVQMMTRTPDNRVPFDAFNAKLEQLGLQYAKSIADTERGSFERHYTVRYKRKRRVLQWHLGTRGNSTAPERTLRIYFFFDDEAKAVVVGWLPSHLPNRLTP